MEQWSEKHVKRLVFLQKYRWFDMAKCLKNIVNTAFFWYTAFVNYSKAYANITLKSTVFWPQIWTLGVRKLIVRLFWDVFGRCWKLRFFRCCFWVAKVRNNRGLGRPRAAKVTSRVRRRCPLAIFGPQGGPNIKDLSIKESKYKLKSKKVSM